MAKRNSQSSNTLWFITGILVMAVAVGLYYLQKQGQPATKQSIPQQHSLPAQHLKQKPQFDFYNVLPKSEKSTTPATPTTASPATKAVPAQAAPKTTNSTTSASAPMKFYLQVASLKSYDDADALKANLLLQGYAVTVVKVTVGQAIRYRVIIGPYGALERAQADQKILRKNKTPSILIKGK